MLPITSLGLQHEASDERISSGIARLDTMLGVKGYFRGATVLLSGTAGSGKSSMAAHFADATCRRGERCLYIGFEESPKQILRNMRSIGIDLEPWFRKGLLQFYTTRSTTQGLEVHLAIFHKLARDFKPQVVIVDPVSTLVQAGEIREATAMLTRLLDFLKAQGITVMLTNLTSGGSSDGSGRRLVGCLCGFGRRSDGIGSSVAGSPGKGCRYG